MRAFVSVASKSLDEILFEVTDGRIDYTDFHIGPVYQCSIKKLTYGDNDYTHCEFIGNRSMEENLADLDRMYKNDVQKIYDTYNTQKSIFTCAAHEEIERYGSLDDEDTEDRRTYEAIRKNLKQWIAERRQFKIDDEYLPHF